MSEKRILRLTKRNHLFEAIAIGRKRCIYILQTPYWTERLEGKEFDEVHIRTGYRSSAPFMRVKCLSITESSQGTYYDVHLGDVLEVQL